MIIVGYITNLKCSKATRQHLIFFLKLNHESVIGSVCWSWVVGRGSEVVGRGFQVVGRGSKVVGSKSWVPSRGSWVVGY